jgi:hypothetical protein
MTKIIWEDGRLFLLIKADFGPKFVPPSFKPVGLYNVCLLRTKMSTFTVNFEFSADAETTGGVIGGD